MEISVQLDKHRMLWGRAEMALALTSGAQDPLPEKAMPSLCADYCLDSSCHISPSFLYSGALSFTQQSYSFVSSRELCYNENTIITLCSDCCGL